jgi:hypothetical protein
MLNLVDLKVNEADDIIFDGYELLVESDKYINTFRNAQRRVSASQSDFLFTDEIAACIETFLQSSIDPITLSDIELNIRTSLTQYSLLDNKEIAILFDDDEDRLGVMIVFKLPNATTQETSFSVFINKQNQKSFR